MLSPLWTGIDMTSNFPAFQKQKKKKKTLSWLLPWNYLRRDKWAGDGSAVDLQSEPAFVLRQCDQTGHRNVARRIAKSRSGA